MANQRESHDDREWDYKEVDEEVERSNPDALEKVINETLMGRLDRPLDPQQMQELVRVANKHAGQELSSEPILVDLVEVILRDSLRSQKISPAELSEMATEIANAMYDAPAAKTRLDAFWSKLQEAAQ